MKSDDHISKSDKPDWRNGFFYKTLLQLMYGIIFNDPKNLHEKRVTVMNNNSEIYGS